MIHSTIPLYLKKFGSHVQNLSLKSFVLLALGLLAGQTQLRAMESIFKKTESIAPKVQAIQLDGMESIVTKRQAKDLNTHIAFLLAVNDSNPNIKSSVPYLIRIIRGDAYLAEFARAKIYLVAKLLKLGADPNLADQRGNTALSWTVAPTISKELRGFISGDFILARVLVNAGADINHQDNFGYSPLHLAVKSDPQLTRFLLSQPTINTSLRTSSAFDKKENPLPNSTPLELARSCTENKSGSEEERRFCKINEHWLSVSAYNQQWHPIERAAFYGNFDFLAQHLRTRLITNPEMLKKAMLWAEEGLKTLQIEAPVSQTGFIAEIYQDQQEIYHKIIRFLSSQLLGETAL